MYSPDDICCRFCEQILPNETKLSGSRGKAWLLNKCGLHEVEVRVKTCQKCQARHGFMNWRAGIK